MTCMLRGGSMIAILDCGAAGNVTSVANAFRRAGAEVKAVRRLDGAGGYDGLVIPGVGSFSTVPKIMAALGGAGGIEKISVPVLCICLGMQALFESSEESPKTKGLGTIAGKVQKINGKVRLPQLGWNRVKIERQDPLFAGIADGEYFYFANSFAAFPKSRGAVLCSTEYGQRFASAVRGGNFWGVQFHPEKSGRAGQRLIGNFIRLCSSGNAAVPSMDIMGGRAVRLRQGRIGTEEFFGSPLALARKYEKAGFGLIHIVDMDAVFGRGSQIALLRKIAFACPRLSIQWAGGIRSFEAAKKALDCGARRVVVGTALVSSPEIVRKCSEEFGSDRVWASLDFSGKPPRMMVRGWKESASLGLKEAMGLAESCGVGGMIISSVDADGMGSGPNFSLLKRARALSRMPILLAGGMRSPDDVKSAISLGADGAIVGRALYDRKIRMGEWLCLGKI
ncbi:MAG: imidazole glycerol phosphate synthase subunit HisH [Candidatus Micrarchaeota archaeon]|nr:imidazole glycerol phosphate synthase subunit HisH [Candidatus Micrarchaeota archaeon]